MVKALLGLSLFMLPLMTGWDSSLARSDPAQVPAASCAGRFPSTGCFVQPNGTPRSSEKSESSSPQVLSAANPLPQPVEQEADTPDITGSEQDNATDLPLSKDELFGVAKPGDVTKKGSPPVAIRGFIQNETAYTYADPTHWSRAVVRAQIGASGQLSDNLKWKATVRGDVDPVYIWSNFYNDAVKKDERSSFIIEETYLDTSMAGWDLRIGRQQIIWGEVVGIFVADVVSAQNQLEFILPDFEYIRIPQWAARGEYFFGDSHLELVWIPYATYNNIGKPGADFYPVQSAPPPGFSQTFLGEVQPPHTLANSNYGMRLTTLKSGWDVSGFYYSSEDAAPTFIRSVTLTPAPTLVYQPEHDRIWQVGGTVGKAFQSVVMHSEVVYTSGRQYNVTRLSEPTGVVPQNTLEYILSFDLSLPQDALLNLQFFQNVFFNHDPDLIFSRFESGGSVLLRGKLGRVEPEILWIQSFNRSENLIRPKLTWHPATNWRAAFGIDIFNGPATSVFGRFNDRDRVYLEARYDF